VCVCVCIIFRRKPHGRLLPSGGVSLITILYYIICISKTSREILNRDLTQHSAFCHSMSSLHPHWRGAHKNSRNLTLGNGREKAGPTGASHFKETKSNLAKQFYDFEPSSLSKLINNDMYQFWDSIFSRMIWCKVNNDFIGYNSN
jgi:hypothetical protein